MASCFFCSEFNFKTCIVLNTSLQVHTRMLLHPNLPIFSSILSFFKVLAFSLSKVKSWNPLSDKTDLEKSSFCQINLSLGLPNFTSTFNSLLTPLFIEVLTYLFGYNFKFNFLTIRSHRKILYSMSIFFISSNFKKENYNCTDLSKAGRDSNRTLKVI